MLYNQIRFDSRQYGQESITFESRIKWLRVDTQTRKTYPFSFLSTRVILQDEYINLDDLTELEDPSLFKMLELQPKPYEADTETLMDITFERDLN